MRTTTRHLLTSAHRSRAAQAAATLMLAGCALGSLTACGTTAGAAAAQPSTTTVAARQTSAASHTGGTVATGGTTSTGDTTSTATSTGDTTSTTTTGGKTASSGAGGNSGPVIDLRATDPDLVALASPSGGIVCTLSHDAGSATTIRCDVGHATWTVPSTTTCQGGNVGDSVSATPQGAALTCHTDTIMGTAAIGQPGTDWAVSSAASHAHDNATLPYGTTLLVTDSAGCTSHSTGMTCWTGGHRFTVSRATYRLDR